MVLHGTPPLAGELVFRVLGGLLVGGGLAIGGYYRRRADRTGGDVTDGDGRFRFVRYVGLLVAAVLLGWLFRPDWIAWASVSLPPAVRFGGAGLSALALPLFVWVFRSLAANVTVTSATRTDHELVRSGPYRWVRHPLYTASAGFWTGIVVLAGNWLLAVLFVPVVLGLRKRTVLEEARLADEFGDDYRSYAARTGRYLPRLRRSG